MQDDRTTGEGVVEDDARVVRDQHVRDRHEALHARAVADIDDGRTARRRLVLVVVPEPVHEHGRLRARRERRRVEQAGPLRDRTGGARLLARSRGIQHDPPAGPDPEPGAHPTSALVADQQADIAGLLADQHPTGVAGGGAQVLGGGVALGQQEVPLGHLTRHEPPVGQADGPRRGVQKKLPDRRAVPGLDDALAGPLVEPAGQTVVGDDDPGGAQHPEPRPRAADHGRGSRRRAHRPVQDRPPHRRLQAVGAQVRQNGGRIVAGGAAAEGLEDDAAPQGPRVAGGEPGAPVAGALEGGQGRHDGQGHPTVRTRRQAHGAHAVRQLDGGGAEEDAGQARAGGSRARAPHQRVLTAGQGRLVQVGRGPPGAVPGGADGQLVVASPGARRDHDAAQVPGRTTLQGHIALRDAGGVESDPRRLREARSWTAGAGGAEPVRRPVGRCRDVGQPGGDDPVRNGQRGAQPHPPALDLLAHQTDTGDEALVKVAVPRVIGVEVGLRDAPAPGAPPGDEGAVVVNRLDEQVPGVLGRQAAHIGQADDLQAVRRPPPHGGDGDQPQVGVADGEQLGGQRRYAIQHRRGGVQQGARRV